MGPNELSVNLSGQILDDDLRLYILLVNWGPVIATKLQYLCVARCIKTTEVGTHSQKPVNSALQSPVEARAGVEPQAPPRAK